VDLNGYISELRCNNGNRSIEGSFIEAAKNLIVKKTKQPLRHLSLKQLTFIEQRIGNLFASHRQPFSTKPKFSQPKRITKANIRLFYCDRLYNFDITPSLFMSQKKSKCRAQINQRRVSCFPW
jgi:hypothetical protein